MKSNRLGQSGVAMKNNCIFVDHLYARVLILKALSERAAQMLLGGKDCSSRFFPPGRVGTR
jgi:hypothetical protein